MASEEKTETKTEEKPSETAKTTSNTPLKEAQEKRGIVEKAKEARHDVSERIREEAHEVKEKIYPFSARNKQERADRKEERKTEYEARRKERKVQAEERGKRIAKQDYAPHQTATKKASNFAEGAARGSKIAKFKAQKKSSGGGYYDMFGMGQQAPRRAPPMRTTTFNPKTGKTTTTEPIMEPKKKTHAQEPWGMLGGSADMLMVPEMRTRSTNAFDLDIMQPRTHPQRKQGKGKKERAQPRMQSSWSMEDMFTVPKHMRIGHKGKHRKERGIGDLL